VFTAPRCSIVVMSACAKWAELPYVSYSFMPKQPYL
jgi:hypothetical protein